MRRGSLLREKLCGEPPAGFSQHFRKPNLVKVTAALTLLE